jgi:hypothetical protein
VYVIPSLPFANGYRYWSFNNKASLYTLKAIYICDFRDKAALHVLKKNFKQVRLLRVGNFKNNFASSKIYIYSANN